MARHYDSTPTLPYDIFQGYIIPDILSQHIHSLLIDQEQPSWHPFYVLPLVCRTFNETCRVLIARIFGIDATSSGSGSRDKYNVDDESDDDDSDLWESESRNELTPADMLQYALSVSRKAYKPDSGMNQTHHFHNAEDLLEQNSLVRLYTCIALGKLFFNADVLCPLGILSRTKKAQLDYWDDDDEEEDEDNNYEGQVSMSMAATTFDEANLHRFFMPFECAQKLCDRVVPDRLAMIAAHHLVGMLPYYHSLFMLSKYYRDLRFNVDREYDFTLKIYSEWVMETLTLLENAKADLIQIMKSGELIYSLWQVRVISTEAIQTTRILEALDDVVKAEWVDAFTTTLIRKRASMLILEWTR